MPTISVIVATAKHGAIGANNQLLCYMPNDLKHFKTLTTGHTIIMGHNTYKSLPKGALPNRTNIVVSRSSVTYPNTIVVESIEAAIAQSPTNCEIFIIGGAQIYNQTVDIADKLYVTEIDAEFDNADTFFPAIDKAKWSECERVQHPADEKHEYPYAFVTYVRV